jgi:hypothetical protein
MRPKSRALSEIGDQNCPRIAAFEPKRRPDRMAQWSRGEHGGHP